jgi:hypothetical protein
MCYIFYDITSEKFNKTDFYIKDACIHDLTSRVAAVTLVYVIKGSVPWSDQLSRLTECKTRRLCTVAAALFPRLSAVGSDVL